MKLTSFDTNKPLKILVVDDDPRWLHFVEFILESELNVSPLLASSGHEALDILETHTVGLVVTDLQMPVMNGIEFLQHARLVSPATKVMIMSAAFEPSTPTARALIAAGAAATISKVEIGSRLANLVRDIQKADLTDRRRSNGATSRSRRLSTLGLDSN